MIRKFRILALALFAVLAMSALGAAAAQATPTIITSSASVAVHGTGENVGEKFVVEGEGGPVETICKVSHYVGTAKSSSSTLKLHPTYTECTLGGIKVDVETGSCDYEFHLTSKVSEDNYRANVDVSCESGAIVIRSTLISCEATVGTQAGLKTVDINNMTANGDVTIQPTLTGAPANGKNGPVKYTVVKDGFGCPLNGAGEKTGGEYSSSSPITGTAAAPETVSVSGE